MNWLWPLFFDESMVCMWDNQQWVVRTAIAAWVGLIVVSVGWELWWAPLREGGSWMVLKALPLCLPLAGILKGKIYTYQYSSMLVLLYFAEAVMRLADANVASRWCALAALLCCVVFFVADLRYLQLVKRSRA